MPTYKFKNNKTGEEFEEFMSISKRESYLAENPDIVQVPVAATLVYEPGTSVKVDDGFREVLSKIKETYKINNIKDY